MNSKPSPLFLLAQPHTVSHCLTLSHTGSHCLTLSHTVSHCLTLSHTASHWPTTSHLFGRYAHCDHCHKCVREDYEHCFSCEACFPASKLNIVHIGAVFLLSVACFGSVCSILCPQALCFVCLLRAFGLLLFVQIVRCLLILLARAVTLFAQTIRPCSWLLLCLCRWSSLALGCSSFSWPLLCLCRQSSFWLLRCLCADNHPCFARKKRNQVRTGQSKDPEHGATCSTVSVSTIPAALALSSQSPQHCLHFDNSLSKCPSPTTTIRYLHNRTVSLVSLSLVCVD